MGQKTTTFRRPALVSPTLDRGAAERVAKWVTEWHGADYDVHEISAMLEHLPSDIPIDDLLDPFDTLSEETSVLELARLALALVSHVERSRMQSVEACAVFRMACLQLCNRGIPFEETAKGNDMAQWLHFIGFNEFGDTDDFGYATDLSDIRLLARYFIDPDGLAETLFDKPNGEFPTTFHEGYVGIAGALGDWRAAPCLLRVLSRCEDAPSVATTITALGMLGRARDGWSPTYRDRIVQVLAGYAYSDTPEVATSAVLALEALGGIHAEVALHELMLVLPRDRDLFTAHLNFTLQRLQKGEGQLQHSLIQTAVDTNAPQVTRVCAIERMAGSDQPETIRALAGLLDDTTVERISVDGLLTDDVIHVIREAAYMAMMDCRFRDLAEVLGEPVLARLEAFQTTYPPSWWIRMRIGDYDTNLEDGLPL